MSKLPEYAKHIASKVDEFIYETVKGSPELLYNASLHYVKAGGKRLRPLITVLSCRVCGGNEDLAVPGAAAIEILHTFTLIHDDIIDRDELRRGVPTVHKLWGEDIAIIAGDTLHAYAYKCLLRALERGAKPESVLRAFNHLIESAIVVAEGQTLDLLLSRKETASIDEYLEMVEKKTASLMIGSALIGASLAGAPPEIENRLREAMKAAGIAFQIRDDILGLLGDEKVLGKPVLSDLREGKRTILVIYTLSVVDEMKKRKLLSVLGKRDASIDELREAAEIIKSCGAVEYADKIAEEYAKKALELINSIETRDLEARELLKELVQFMIRRRY